MRKFVSFVSFVALATGCVTPRTLEQERTVNAIGFPVLLGGIAITGIGVAYTGYLAGVEYPGGTLPKPSVAPGVITILSGIVFGAFGAYYMGVSVPGAKAAPEPERYATPPSYRGRRAPGTEEPDNPNAPEQKNFIPRTRTVTVSKDLWEIRD